jgi:hypothetical protein
MRASRQVHAALLTALPLSLTSCSEPTAPVPAPAPAFAVSQSLEHAGARRFVSYGGGCFEEVIGYEELDGTVRITFLNHNFEVSRDPWVQGPAEITIRITVDAATGEPLTLDGSFLYMPEGVAGTWVGTVLPMEFRNGKLGHIRGEGTGTGELAGYGYRFAVNLNARAAFAPPRIECAVSTPFLTTGEIFVLE